MKAWKACIVGTPASGNLCTEHGLDPDEFEASANQPIWSPVYALVYGGKPVRRDTSG